MTDAADTVAAAEENRPAEPGVLDRVATGTAWKLIGMLGSRPFTIVAMICAARMLGITDFGKVGMVRSTVGMFGVLAGLGLGVTATKYIADLRDKDTERLGRILSLVLVAQTAAVIVTAVVIVALAGTLASRAINAPQLADELRMAAALLCLLALSRLASDALAGFEAWRAVALVAIVEGAVTLPGILVLVPTHGVAGAVAALTLAAGAGALVGGAVLVRRCRLARVSLHFRGMWSEAGALWRFVLPATLTALTVGPVLWAANAILVNLNAQDGYDKLGAFVATLPWKNLVMFVPGALAAAFLPVLSQIHSRGDRRGFDDAVTMQVNLLSLSVIPLAVLVICASRYILLLYGRDFGGHELLLSVVVFGAVIHAMTGALSNALVSSGRMWLRLIMYAVSGAVLVGAAWLGIPRLGALGLALGYICGYAVHCIWQLASLRSSRVTLSAALLSLGAACASGAAYALTLLPPLSSLVAGTVLAASSFGVAWLCTPLTTRLTLASFLRDRNRNLSRAFAPALRPPHPEVPK